MVDIDVITLNGFTREQLAERFSYSAETGLLYHRIVGGGRTDGPAGTANHYGYLVVRVGRALLLVHRIAWFLENGTAPERIDHQDGMRTNNRLSNLRPCTQQENVCNAARRRDNTSGWKGVSYDPRRGKWSASIQMNGQKHGCGYFHDKREAAEARMFAALAVHGDFARLA